jgi:demethylmenaquinone methyltransferase/2-methoxy-6-polyprenyl-1,4-benzoquinol methylase
MSEQVHKMFAGIAGDYDRANTVLSFGIHHIWRRRAIRYLRPCTEPAILDICTGTGDLAFEFERFYNGNCRITGTDFVVEMLELAEVKKSRNEGSMVTFAQADSMNLPFADNIFDVVSVAFGIRNVDDTPKCLQEILRVLKPGGQILVLEFGQPHLPGFRQIFDLYSKHVMPLIGGVVTGDRNAYEYLPDTSRRYPCRSEFTDLMQSNGFEKTRYISFFGGIAYAYYGDAPSLDKIDEQ